MEHQNTSMATIDETVVRSRRQKYIDMTEEEKAQRRFMDVFPLKPEEDHTWLHLGPSLRCSLDDIGESCEYEENDSINARVGLLHAGIERMEVDVIVNAAYPNLKEGNGYTNIINRNIFIHADRNNMQQECDLALSKHGIYSPGQCVVTAGYLLPARYVIHAVLSEKDEDIDLAVFYTRLLKTAEGICNPNAQTIAFPLLGLGDDFGWSLKEIVPKALKAARNYLQVSKQIQKIFFVVETTEAYFALLKSMPWYFPINLDRLTDEKTTKPFNMSKARLPLIANDPSHINEGCEEEKQVEPQEILESAHRSKRERSRTKEQEATERSTQKSRKKSTSKQKEIERPKPAIKPAVKPDDKQLEVIVPGTATPPSGSHNLPARQFFEKMTLEEKHERFVKSHGQEPDWTDFNTIPSWENDYTRDTIKGCNSCYQIDRKINRKVSLWRGDMTKLAIDCVVNAANVNLANGGGICGAIFNAAGVDLLEAECKMLKGTPTGTAKNTAAYLLPAKYIVHAVGPWIAGCQATVRDKEQLQGAYLSSLKEVEKLRMKSVGFPCISTKIYGYPMEEATSAALSAIRQWLQENLDKIERIVFVVFSPEDEQIYNTQMHKYFPRCSGGNKHAEEKAQTSTTRKRKLEYDQDDRSEAEHLNKKDKTEGTNHNELRQCVMKARTSALVKTLEQKREEAGNDHQHWTPLSKVPRWPCFKQARHLDEKEMLYSPKAHINFRVTIWQGDVEKLEVDAVVCPVYYRLLPDEDNVIGRAIHKSAGQDMTNELKFIEEAQKAGEVFTTAGYYLPAKFVFHTVAPRKIIDNTPGIFQLAYKNILHQAALSKVSSLGLSLLTPETDNAYEEILIALRVVREWLEDDPYAKKIDCIVFTARNVENFAILKREMPKYFPELPTC